MSHATETGGITQAPRIKHASISHKPEPYKQYTCTFHTKTQQLD